MERSPGAQLSAGSEFAGYRVEGLVGRGGMGVVYRARDLALGRTVALKLLAPELAGNEHYRERFHRESRLAASIDHPNVVPVYEAGEASSRLYIAMRHVEGTDLGSLLSREGPLEPSRALTLAAQVAEALDAAHARGLVHRDVKPSNVLIASERGREHCYLADFGLTKRAESRTGLTGSGQLLGTPDYLAPEQIVRGAAEPASDRYSLACLLFECLTGEPPYRRGSEYAVLWAHVHEPPPAISERRAELPKALDPVFATALAKEPAERHRTGRLLVEAARAAFPGATITPPAPGGWRRALAAAGLTAVVLAAYAAGLLDAPERDTVDARFSIRGNERPPEDIVVVGIDDVTLSELQVRPPFPRSLHARAVDRLSEAGARVIAYDINFSGPMETREDLALIGAVDRADRVVLATTEVEEGGQTNLLGGDAVLLEAGARVGSSNLVSDDDGVIRRQPYEVEGLVSFAIAAAEEFEGRRRAPRTGFEWIDYRGPPGTVRYVSFSRLVEGRAPDEVFRGKIAVIGATTPSLDVVHQTPVGGGDELMSEPEVQANAIATALDDFPLREAPAVLNVGLILVLGLVGPAIAALRLGPLRAAVFGALVAVLFAVAVQVAFNSGLIVSFLYPLGSLLLGVVGALVKIVVVRRPRSR